jgi:hypothetical protein
VAFAKLGPDHPDVLIVGLSGELFNLRDPIAEGARKFSIPVIYSFEGFVKAADLRAIAASMQHVAPSDAGPQHILP